MNYTNNTRRENAHTDEYLLGLCDNYSVVKDEPNEVVLENKTSPLDEAEIVSFRFKRIKRIDTSIDIQNPAAVQQGVQYAVQIEDLVRNTTETGVSTDYPVVMYLTVRHNRAAAVTPQVLSEIFERLLSALRRESDNSYRFDDLLRGALRPNVN